MTAEPISVDEREEQLHAILADWLEAIERGQSPIATDYLARFPQFASELKRHFATWEHFHAPSQITSPSAELAADSTSEPATEEDSSPRRPAAAPQIPGYDILEELGRGGMGVVYKARQLSLDRVVAVKVLRSGDLGSDAEIQRLRNEAALLAQLDHPNLIRIYEVGEQGGQPWFSMEFVDGGSLGDQLERFRDDPRAAAQLLAIIARAVHHAHQRGVLHRDLKPGNILLVEGGGWRLKGEVDPSSPTTLTSPLRTLHPPLSTLHPKVSDFGLARRLDNDSDLTRTGDLVGTPSYMSPEQAEGRRGAVTTATDVYGLGAVLYALLTGRPPFRGIDALDTLVQVRTLDAVPPRTRNSLVDRDLQTICLKCLEKNPDRRYAAAAALADDLERWLVGEPIRARRSSLWERGRKWTRRRPAAAALVVAGVLAIVGAIGGLLLYTHNLDKALAVSDQLRKDGLAREARLRRFVYVADMRSARIGWERGQSDRALELLERYLPKEHEEDLRGYEWHYLMACCRPEGRHLGSHDAPIWALAVSPDERWAATGDIKGNIKIWDLATGEEKRRLSTVEREINTLQFSPDGRLLASAGQELGIRLWDTATWTEKKRLLGITKTVRSVSFSPDGTKLAAGSVDNTIKVWDLTATIWPKSFVGHQGPVQRVEWGPDGTWLASSSNDKTTRLWNAKTGQILSTLEAIQGSSLLAQALSPNASLVATGGYNPEIHVRKRSDGSLLGAFQTPVTVRHLIFARGRPLLIGAGNDGWIFLLELSEGGRLRRTHCFVRATRGNLRGVALADGERTLIAVGESGSVDRWSLEPLLGSWPPPNRGPFSVDAFPDRWLLEVGADGQIYLRDRVAGARVDGLQVLNHPKLNAFFSPCGSLLATREQGGHMTVWDTKTGAPVANFGGRPEDYLLAVFSPTGTMVATGGGNGEVQLWDSRSGRRLFTLRRAEAQHGVHCLHFTSDGRGLFTGTHDESGDIELWNIEKRECAAVLHLKGGLITTLAFSPNEKLLAVASRQGMIKILDFPTGQELATLTGHQAEVRGLAFSPDGKTLASVAADGVVRLWHVSTLQELFALAECPEKPNLLVFSPDGKALTACHGRPLSEAKILRRRTFAAWMGPQGSEMLPKK